MPTTLTAEFTIFATIMIFIILKKNIFAGHGSHGSEIPSLGGGAAQRQEHQEFKVILTVDWGTAWSAGDPVEKQEAAFENPDS